jgi:GT2 family glycosyltransferase
MTGAPTASVVMATYNRSYLLRHSIGSLLLSDFSDFELIVVGDGCTDDTAEVVRSFADPRIRFVNLPSNSGFQSVPNNTGVDLARGRYILFLNQDDLYFPDHLATSIAFMEREKAEIAWSPVLLLHKSGRENGPPDPNYDVISLDGVPARPSFDPRIFIIGSSWIARADAYRAVGPWRAPEATRLSPSQEWLFRAHRQGRRLAYHRHVSVLCIHGGVRRHSYLIRSSPEHERAFSWITGGEELRCALLECAALQQSERLREHGEQLQRVRADGPSRTRRFAVEVLRRLGVHPIAAERVLDGVGKGDWVAQIRRFTGEAPPLAIGEALRVGTVMAEPYLGRGWHDGDGEGRWSAERSAELVFGMTTDAECVLELSGRPLQASDTVTFAVNGTPALPIRRASTFWLTITVPQLVSPASLDASSKDTRRLGFWLSWVRIVPAALPSP